jgi:RNA polymerase sigma factor (sigma-70 family)
VPKWPSRRRRPVDPLPGPPPIAGSDGEEPVPTRASSVLADTYDGEVALLSGAARGEPVAVRALLDTTGPTVYGFVYARIGGDAALAEDIVQDTFVEAVRSAHTFRGDAALTTWLCAIARRRLARWYERERREQLARSGLVAVDEWRPAVEDRDELVRALGRLPAVHRQVLVLKYLDDRSVEEIAAELGRSRVQVQSLLQRARDGLRRAMTGEAGAEDD